MPKVKSAKDVNKNMCKTCMFRYDENSVILSHERLAEIKAMLITGTNQICHTNNRICRGGRNYQLEMFKRMGFIEEASDESLYAAMARDAEEKCN